MHVSPVRDHLFTISYGSGQDKRVFKEPRLPACLHQLQMSDIANYPIDQGRAVGGSALTVLCSLGVGSGQTVMTD
eukprot:11515-Eustigmatos_ZCMA.PRE.1